MRRRGPAAFAAGALLLALAGTAPAQDDLDAILGGFEEEDDAFQVDEETAPPPAPRWWDLDGSALVAASVNYLDHRSPTGTSYTGVTKTRLRLNLELDLELPYEWTARLAGYAFYDAAYRWRGRDEFTRQVLDDYEWEVDTLDVWVRGPVAPRVDVQLGRQVVNWGRSETVRVLDVLNPLDNREPGLADLEDLRLPVTMGTLDAYLGPWTLTGVVVPEFRPERLPPFGSDFFPFPVDQPDRVHPNDFTTDTELAARVRGVFSGWDVSLIAAWVWEDVPHAVPAPGTPTGAAQEFSRYLLAGGGGNYAVGSWLVKGEAAVVEDREVALGEEVTTPLGVFALPVDTADTTRVDVMLGAEYYGFVDTTLVAEAVVRHLTDYESRMAPFDVDETEVIWSLRATRDWLRARLHTLAVAVLVGERVQDGAIIRLQADYDLRDALVATAGLLIYEGGDDLFLDAIDANDRLFLQLKYSF